MSTRSRTSETIEPYLRLPEELSLLLLTGTLGCTPHWLTARLVHSILTEDVTDDGRATAIVFVSWARDLPFWKNELRRTTGIDVARFIDKKRFAFVNFLAEMSTTTPEKCISTTESFIENAVSEVGDRRVFIALDNPDLLLCLGMTTAHEMNNLLLRLRSKVSSMILSCSGDTPFVAAATTPLNADFRTPIEMECAAFIVQQAHNARLVLSVRDLDTGAARDVSGVLRATRGGSWYHLDDDGYDKQDSVVIGGMEALYLVRRDGGVEISERRNTS